MNNIESKTRGRQCLFKLKLYYLPIKELTVGTTASCPFIVGLAILILKYFLTMVVLCSSGDDGVAPTFREISIAVIITVSP